MIGVTRKIKRMMVWKMTGVGEWGLFLSRVALRSGFVRR